MTLPFKLADSDAPATDRFEVFLVNHIRDNWTIETPVKEEINFSTRWEENGKWYDIVVEPTGDSVAQRFLGNARTRYKETKMIQLSAEDVDSQAKIWRMADHIKDILNEDPRALAADGINTILVGNLNNIPVTKQMLADMGYAPDGGNNVRRGYILCDLYFDKVKY